MNNTNEIRERTPAGTLRKDDAGRHVALAGWVQKRRDFGELIFIDLRDRSGICQVVVDLERTESDVVAAAKEVRSEYVIRIEGEIVERNAEMKNPKMETATR